MFENGAGLLFHCDRHRIGVYGGVFAQQCRWCPAGILSPGLYRPHEWPAAHNTAPEESQEDFCVVIFTVIIKKYS